MDDCRRTRHRHATVFDSRVASAGRLDVNGIVRGWHRHDGTVWFVPTTSTMCQRVHHVLQTSEMEDAILCSSVDAHPRKADGRCLDGFSAVCDRHV